MALIDNPEAANRLARAIASDIMLYNEEKIVEGLKNDSLFDVLDAELAEGRELYKSRVSPGLMDKHNFFDRAIVDVLIRTKGRSIESKIW